MIKWEILIAKHINEWQKMIELKLKIIHQFFFMLNYFFYDEYVNLNKAIINNNELINN